MTVKALLLIPWCLFFVSGSSGEYLSPFALVSDGERLFLACAGKVMVIESEKVTGEFTFPDQPGGLALQPGGQVLVVTGDSGQLHWVDLDSGKIRSFPHEGHTPVSPVFSPDGKRLYVLNRFDNNVSVLDIESGSTVATIPVKREPVAAAVTPDGHFLFVANHLPAGAADGDYAGAEISVIDTKKNSVVSGISLPDGSTGLRGLCMAPEGKHVYVTHILARYQLPTTQLERGWMNTNAVSIIDVAGKRLIDSVLLDDVDLGAANPWGVACSPDGRHLCIAHAGSHEVSVIDCAALHAKLEMAEAVSGDLSFLVGIRRRHALGGNGPRGLIVAQGKVYVAQYFTDSVGVVDLENHEVTQIMLGKAAPLTAAREGEMHFNDANNCFQQWQCCATCHPDGRTDGLNWDLLNDGMGNPRNTKSLLLAHATPPVMITGVRDRAETAVRTGIRHIQFAQRPEACAVAMDEYLKSMKPVRNPAQPGDAVERGRALFERAGCVVCHPPPLYTDMKQHEMAIGGEFDTPTLVEVWRTAPYLFDGRAATMADLLSLHNPGTEEGGDRKLSSREIADLAAFVLSL